MFQKHSAENNLELSHLLLPLQTISNLFSPDKDHKSKHTGLTGRLFCDFLQAEAVPEIPAMLPPFLLLRNVAFELVDKQKCACLGER